MLFFEELQGLFMPAVVDQGNKTLDADMGMTGGFTGGCSRFSNTVSTGDCLRIHFIDCFTKVVSFVVLVWEGDGADLFALAAARAF